ncbi:MAG: NAD-dependent epimerase/dehydratase family protein [Rhodospirillaceae bacterium]|jgi:nucleoside-diphosphate-sugar epimerase/CBS domain-containing protein|nr:NAD-dependent epimerase/dehydratase family protein [Rhodospirillaceae bacterium]MBT3926042.1 NAD-dependent epimerase/dehydratase family protein [Rhodospirillaceae bacterium]MBT4425988.1 NAD-dependent epimerase/dehydratase family protein [Rhodospirillaceae bacterium]MBT5039244.1 NAD-dependent epimerase/dehydratase family protein [Rhodospirillaceae bacterium]MBT5674972.1 NAD-dependent epimerase/dehydratase family protein [Rhodospirillaceae bacterium]
MTNKTESDRLAPLPALHLNDPISTAMESLGDRYGAIVSIVDDNGRLSGIVSAGDLRRAILHGQVRATPLSDVMNSEPVTIVRAELESEESVNRALASLKALYATEQMHVVVPVVDGERRPLGAIDVQSLLMRAPGNDFLPHRRTALVVGGAGYIGSVLVRKLLADGWAVRVLDLFLYGRQSLAGLEDQVDIVTGDAKNIDTLVDAVEGVDAVVYLAELVGDPAVAEAPQTALKTNYLAVTALAQLCEYLNINRFVYTSSCSVYGASANPDEFLTELSPTAPVSLYGKIKLMVEEAVLSMARRPNQLFAPTILRLGTVYGCSPRARFDLVVNTLTKHAATRGAIDLFGGEQWRPHVHVGDVARAIVSVLDAPLDSVRAEIFNVGDSEQNYTINAIGDLVAEAFPEMTVNRMNSSVDPRNYRVDCAKLRDALDYEIETNVAAGVQELKAALESGDLGDLDQPSYSNLLTVRDLAFD